MRIKQHSTQRLVGIPLARATVSTGQDGDSPTVTMFISALDVHDMPTVRVSIRMPPAEALDLARRIADEAQQALALNTQPTLPPVASPLAGGDSPTGEPYQEPMEQAAGRLAPYGRGQ